MSTCTHVGLVAQHFAGRLRPEDERRLRLHLSGCAECKDAYNRQLVLADLTSSGEPARVRLARGLGLRRRRIPAALVAGTASAAVAAMLGLAWYLGAPRHEVRFAARGAQVTRLVTYRIPPGGPPQPVAGEIGAGDELAFAYENPKHLPYLLVFGVDEHGHVYWFHPAWTDETEAPRSVAISPEPGLHELTEAVGHGYDGTSLVVHGVFSDHPLSVREVDRGASSLLADTPVPDVPPDEQTVQVVRIRR